MGKIQTIDDGIFVRQRHVLHIQSRAFHAIHGEVLLLLPILLCLLTETPSVAIAAAAIADPRLLSFRSITFVFHRSRPLVVLVEGVKILNVRLPVLFEITQNGELARGRRWCSRSCQRRVVLVVVYRGGEEAKRQRESRCERGCCCLD